MALAIVESLPVHSPWVPTVLESIINKKIAEVALNKIEELIDWLFAWLYSPYNKLYEEKKERVHVSTVVGNSLLLFDRTREGQFSIPEGFENGIYLGEHRVVFGNSRCETLPGIKVVKWIIAENDPFRGDYYKLIEERQAESPVCWQIRKTRIYEDPDDQSTFCMATSYRLESDPATSSRP